MVGGSHGSCKGKNWCKNSDPKNRKQLKRSAASAGFDLCNPKGKVAQIVECDESEGSEANDNNNKLAMPTTSSTSAKASVPPTPPVTKRPSAANPKFSQQVRKIEQARQFEGPMDTDEVHNSFLLEALKKMPGTATAKGQTRYQIAIILENHDIFLLDRRECMAISAWFAEQCNDPPLNCTHLSPKVAEKYDCVKQLFVLSSDAGEEIPGLVQVPLDYDVETYLKRFLPIANARPENFKREGATDSMNMDTPMAETESQKSKVVTPIEETYKALFQLLKLSPPGVILFKDEHGVKATLLSYVALLGSRLQALSTLRTNMGNLFYRMGPTRWAAIEKDPPLWLCIAETLEDAEIYKEAAVHLIGCQLKWAPEWSVPRSRISQAAMDKLERSADKLMLQILKVKQALNQATVRKQRTFRSGTVTSELVSPDSNPATWIVVSICREFWAANCAVLDDGLGNYNMQMIAHLYRTIERGGETYLTTQGVHNLVKAHHPNSVSEVMWVLPEMKNFASEQVRPLLKNNLQYNGGKLLGYFTCVELEEKDFPFEVKRVEDSDF